MFVRKAWGLPGLLAAACSAAACSVEPAAPEETSPTEETASIATSASALAIGGRCAAPSLATGDSHACIVRPGGTVACWGGNASHQLGSATPTYLATPTDVSGVTNAVAVTAGSAHTCALLDDGTVRCWGANTSGQLGSGALSRYEGPVAVAGLTGITSLSAGSQHTCALRNDGTIWCWGANGSGRLGDGTTTRRASPVQVQRLTDAVSVSAGGSHTCAITRGGLGYCWGSNSIGQLGDGTTTWKLRPTLVGGDRVWRSLSAGRDHTCGVSQAAGNGVFCWGRNQRGDLGDGTTVTVQTLPVPVLTAGQGGDVPLTDGVSATAGTMHSCAILGDGRAVCWGGNTYGQLGDGTTAQRATATAVSAPAPAVGPTLLLSAGNYHTCALALGGEVHCFGNNAVGQLGDGTRTRRLVPTRVGSSTGLTFATFASEDGVSGVNGATASSVLAAGDELFAAGVEHEAGLDRWVVRRSRDRGANWRTVGTFESPTLGAPRLARLATGTLFLAGTAVREDGSTAWLVRRSVDGGDTWTEADVYVLGEQRAASVRQAAVDESGILYVAGSAAAAGGAEWLVRGTANTGATWFVADSYTSGAPSEAHAVLDTGAGLFAIGHVTTSQGVAMHLRHTAAVVATDLGTLWTDLADFQLEPGRDTYGEALAIDAGGRLFALARADSAAGWVAVIRVSTDGGATWATASTFQLEQGADTEGYDLLADRGGTLHIVGRGTRAGSRHGFVASSYDHGATWIVSDELSGESTLTDAAEDSTGAVHTAGSAGAGAASAWTLRSRACHGLAPSCGNFVIDPGESCDGDCSDCDDHDACTTDVMTGAPTTCNVSCTHAAVTTCVSGDGCCTPGCTSDLDSDCCTGPLDSSGRCVDVSFQLTALDATGCTAVEHQPLTGTSRGGLAVSSTSLFYTGNGPNNRGVTGRFSLDLTQRQMTRWIWEQLFSDLATGTPYVLGAGHFALSRTGGLATSVIPLDPTTGALLGSRSIPLSPPIRVTTARAFFSGYGRLLLHNGAHLYDIWLPSGRVTDLGSVALPEHRTCPNGGTWGVAESFGGALYVDYVAGSEVRRTRVPSGQTTVLQSFTNLGDMCSFTVSPATRRWYFHNAGASQFASGQETIGFCGAELRRPNAPSVCGDGILEAAETCDGDCPASCADSDPCTIDEGTPSACDCTHRAVTTCAGGDGCCAAGCDALTDSDCPSTNIRIGVRPVSGGSVSSSAHYRMTGTVGAPGSIHEASSSSYRMQAGTVRALPAQ